jgi:hypothetical protein
VAAHLRTVVIPQVEDQSGASLPTVRLDIARVLSQKVRDDNSLKVIDNQNADSRLEVTVTSVNVNVKLSVSGAEIETVRGVQIDARSTFFDNVKRRAIYKDRVRTGRGSYNISQGQAGEAQALRDAINELTNQILNDTVADW